MRIKFLIFLLFISFFFSCESGAKKADSENYLDDDTVDIEIIPDEFNDNKNDSENDYETDVVDVENDTENKDFDSVENFDDDSDDSENPYVDIDENSDEDTDDIDNSDPDIEYYPDEDFNFNLENFKAIYAGAGYTCGLSQDSNAFCWGYNDSEQLGIQNVSYKNRIIVPTEVNSSVKFDKIFTAHSHICALDEDGKAYCWGNNSYKKLGVEKKNQIVVAVDTTIRFLTLALGNSHSCGLDLDGVAYCWGGTNYGSLGIGIVEENQGIFTPTKVDTDKKFQSLAAGAAHTCGLTNDGKVYCWGENNSGQLGNNTTENSFSPSKVDAEIVFKTITASEVNTCGLNDAGEAYCWGSNYCGQLGIGVPGSNSDALVPVKVSTDVKFVSLDAGSCHICGIDENDSAYCWGHNYIGEAGSNEGGTISKILTPHEMKTDLKFKSLSAGRNHSCGLDSAGKAYCWGNNSDGQAGNGHMTFYKDPVEVKTDYKFTHLALSSLSSFAVNETGEIFVWGLDNSFGAGEMGEWLFSLKLYPAEFETGLQMNNIVSNGNHVCGLNGENKSYCWGFNSYGQLGSGNTDDNFTPNEINTDVVFKSFAVGKSHSCGIDPAGKAYCWGSNSKGQLGNTITEDSLTPEAVNTSLSFEMLTAGQLHTCGLDVDGDIYCWGENSKGQLGDGSNTKSNTPVKVISNKVFEFVASNRDHNCALTTLGDIYCWGFNSFGQLGNGTLDNSSVPVKVDSDLEFVSLTTGGYVNYAMDESGFFYCWGQCNGNGDDINFITEESEDINLTPEKFGADIDLVDIFAGQYHACGLDSDGKVYCWGDGEFGQLGTEIFQEVLIN
ncbi:MAG TPA: hypothetical protein PLB16_09485 [bacterium]|nr:hypothetical protein [bacterium]